MDASDAIVDAIFGADADVVGDRRFRALLVASAVSPLGTAIVSPLLDALTGPFGVTEARIGLLVAAFTAPSIVAIPVVGVLSDRVGRKPVLVTGLTVFGLTGLAVALTTDFRVALALRLLQGLGYCGIGPVLITAVGDLYAGEREATAQGARFTAVGLSLSVAPLAAGLLAGLAWQYPFLLYGLALLAAAVVAVSFEEPDGTDDDGRAGLWGAAALLARPRVAVTLVGRAVPSFVWFAFLTDASIVVRLLGGSAATAGVVVAVASLGSAVGATQVGRLTAAVGGRRLPLLGAGTAAAVGLAGVALAPSVPLAALGAVAVGAGFGVSITLYRSEMTRLAPARRRGSLVSVGESVGRLGSTAAPVVAGTLVVLARPTLGFDGAVRAALLAVTAGALVVGTVCVLAATRLPPPPDAPAAD
ncbi:MAG: MFS transporter [Haloferacaceae archaeon]